MIRGADLAAAVQRGLKARGWPFLAPEMTLHVRKPDAFPTVEVWDDAWGMLVCIVCCDAECQAQAAHDYGKLLMAECEYEVAIKVMWPKGWDDECE